MLIFGRYAGIPVRSHRSPLASECNRDGSTRFFTLNTDPSRIKQELFLFISHYLASCQHIPLSSILRGCFWLLLIFPNNFENFLRNQYSRSKRRWWHLNKKFIHFLTAFEMGPICDGFLSLKTLVFNSKLTVLNILHLNYRYCLKIIIIIRLNIVCCTSRWVITSLGHLSLELNLIWWWK